MGSIGTTSSEIIRIGMVSDSKNVDSKSLLQGSCIVQLQGVLCTNREDGETKWGVMLKEAIAGKNSCPYTD
jgi:hypothetical protein